MEKAVTRRELNKVERRASIVIIARKAFLENGYGATTMSLVAEAIGGSKATLWAYFETKEDLFRAVVDDLTEEFRADLDSAMVPGGNVRRSLTEFCDRFLTKMVSPQSVGLYRLVVGEGARFPAIGRLFYERGPRRVIDSLAAYLQATTDRGALDCEDAQAAATQLVGLCQMVNFRHVLDDRFTVNSAERRRHAKVAADFFLSAYQRTVPVASEVLTVNH